MSWSHEMITNPRKALNVSLLWILLPAWSVGQQTEQAQSGPNAAEQSPKIQAIATVSNRFVNSLLARAVNQSQFVEEFMLGTYTSGPATMQGTVTTRFIPSPDKATLEIQLIGVTNCDNNVGQRRAITIYTAAGANVEAAKRITISNAGIETLATTAASTAAVQVNEIQARSRFVERLAWRRASRMHDEIESAAAQSVRNRVAQQLDQEIATALVEAQKLIQEQTTIAVAKHEHFPCRVAFSSTLEHLQAALIPSITIDSETISPLNLTTKHDAAFAIHESCLNRICEFVCGGKKLEDSMFLQMMEVITGNSPRPLWVHDRTDRWTVTPAKKDPVLAEFDRGVCTLRLRLQQVTRGDIQCDRPIELLCTYANEITADGPHFIRQGELSVQFIDDQPVSAADEDLRLFVQRKFGGVFQPELYFDGLVAPVGGSLSKLRRLQLKELSSENGWAIIGYQLPSDNTKIASVE